MRPSIGLGLEAWKPCSLRPIILLETNLCIVSLSEHRCLKDSACLHTTLRHYLCGLQCSLSSLVDVTVISSAQVYSGCIQLHVNVDCPLGSAKDVVPSWQTAIIAGLETRLPTYHFTSLTESLSRRQSLSKKKKAVWFVTVPLGLNMTPNSCCRWVPVAHAQTHIHGIWVGYGTDLPI